MNKYNIILLAIIIITFIIYINYNKKIILSIQTVFILKENIIFLREWIVYHLNLGFDKIYLYDNTGSIGCDDSNNKQNKYNIPFSKLIKLTNEDIDNELNKILTEFKNKVFYKKWQPKNDKGEIIYGQNESIVDYIKNYGKESDYTAFIDIDEFIFSEENIDIKQFIVTKSKDNYTNFELKQKKFYDRYCNINKKVYEITNCINNINTSSWSPKRILKNNLLDVNNVTNIHILNTTKGKLYIFDTNILRFNHYNVNKKQIEWMKGFYKQETFDISTDNSLNRYANILSNLNNYDKYIDSDTNNYVINNLCVN